MKSILVLCGILTVMATTFAQETATLEIPEPGDGGPSLRVLGDAEINNTLSVTDGRVEATNAAVAVIDGGLEVTGQGMNTDIGDAGSFVKIESSSDDLTGMYGWTENTFERAHSTTGLFGRASGVGLSADCFGVKAIAEGAGLNYGIWAEAKDGQTNYAGYFEGDVRITGRTHTMQLQATAPGANDNVAGLFKGDLDVSGALLLNMEYSQSVLAGIEANVINADQYAEGTIGMTLHAESQTDIPESETKGLSVSSHTQKMGNSYGIFAEATAAVGNGSKVYGLYATASGADRVEDRWAGFFDGRVSTNDVVMRSPDGELRWIFIPVHDKDKEREWLTIAPSGTIVDGELNVDEPWRWQTGITMNSTGKVTIGDNFNVDIHKERLYVDGDIGTSGKLVANAVQIENWTISEVPDYVFKKDYKLRSLQEVEEYVTEKNHLPEVPSAEEIQKNGLDLAEMNMTLLKKVEELTLYTIQQQKQIDELKARLDR